jgi:hypothetical protein
VIRDTPSRQEALEAKGLALLRCELFSASPTASPGSKSWPLQILSCLESYIHPGPTGQLTPDQPNSWTPRIRVPRPVRRRLVDCRRRTGGRPCHLGRHLDPCRGSRRDGTVARHLLEHQLSQQPLLHRFGHRLSLCLDALTDHSDLETTVARSGVPSDNAARPSDDRTRADVLGRAK